MSSFLLDTFNGGFSDHESRGINGAFKYACNFDIRRRIDSLYCQQGLSEEVVPGLDAVGNFFVPASDGNLYMVCRNGKIYKRDAGMGVWSLMYTDSNETTLGIIGAAEWTLDTGKKYLFWTTATRWNLKELPGAADWSDVNVLAGWPKTNLTSAAWHTQAVINGTLQAVNGNTLAFVGYDGSYTNNALQLVPGNIGKALVERGINTIIGCGRNDNLEQAAIFSWDQIADNFVDKRTVPIGSINAMIDTEVPLMQVGTGGYVFYADMISLLPIMSFPGGGQVNPGGVANDNGLALFGVWGNGAGNSGIYSYGRKRKNASFVMNLEYQFDCDEIGAICKTGTDIYVSYKNGSTIGVKKVNQLAKAIGVYESLDLRAPMSKKGDLTLPSWEKIILTTAAMPAGTSVSVKTRMDKTGNFIDTRLQNGNTAFSTPSATEAVFLAGHKGRISEVQITLTPSGNISPEVYKAEYFFG